MARRNRIKFAKRRRPRGARASNNSNFVIVDPSVLIIKENESKDFTFEDCFGGKTAATMLTNVPWRLLSLKFSIISSQLTNSDGALIQVGLHTAMNPNIENVANMRVLVGPGAPLTRVLRMKSPNPWKEDEQKTQTLFTIRNSYIGSSVNGQVTIYFEPRIQFGKIPFVPNVSIHQASTSRMSTPSMLDEVS